MYLDIIDFWFVEIDKSYWWKKDEGFDELIRSKFSNIHCKVVKGELFQWRETCLGRLAEIIVLDQFSRNMYRDQPESFSYDLAALILAQSAISEGYDLDLELDVDKRFFMYLPFMHSESLVIHEQAMTLFTKLGDESALDFENQHKAIIERFGRYPHRNKILGRVSTQEEVEFLTQPKSSF